jgi:hypothetical protein
VARRICKRKGHLSKTNGKGEWFCARCGFAGEPDGATHACPEESHGNTPCCGKSPFALPRTDKLALDPALVTCGGADDA